MRQLTIFYQSFKETASERVQVPSFHHASHVITSQRLAYFKTINTIFMRSKKAIRKPAKKTIVPTPEEIERAQMQMLQAKLQKHNLTDPLQLKMRIIWENLKALMLEIHGRSEDNKAIAQRYEFDFKLAEQAENYYGSDLADFVKEESKSQ
jgi:hypothetical protein